MAVQPGSFVDAAKNVQVAAEVEARLKAAVSPTGSPFSIADPVPGEFASLWPSARIYWGAIRYRGKLRATAVAVSDDGLFLVAVSLPHACMGSIRTEVEKALTWDLGHFPREVLSSDEDLYAANNLAILMAKWVRGEFGPTPPLPVEPTAP
jgi:hypothetical protein